MSYLVVYMLCGDNQITLQGENMCSYLTIEFHPHSKGVIDIEVGIEPRPRDSLHVRAIENLSRRKLIVRNDRHVTASLKPTTSTYYSYWSSSTVVRGP